MKTLVGITRACLHTLVAAPVPLLSVFWRDGVLQGQNAAPGHCAGPLCYAAQDI